MFPLRATLAVRRIIRFVDEVFPKPRLPSPREDQNEKDSVVRSDQRPTDRGADRLGEHLDEQLGSDQLAPFGRCLKIESVPFGLRIYLMWDTRKK